MDSTLAVQQVCCHVLNFTKNHTVMILDLTAHTWCRLMLYQRQVVVLLLLLPMLNVVVLTDFRPFLCECDLHLFQYIQQNIRSDCSNIDKILEPPEGQDEGVWKYEHLRYV